MSATNRSTSRDNHAEDFFQTPLPVTRAVLPYLTVGPVLDPCAGRGAILDAVQDTWGVPAKRLHAIEIQKTLAKDIARKGYALDVGDALKMPWPTHRRQLVLFNPPYTHAAEFVLRALEHVAPVNGTVAALLRIGFAGSIGRVDMHRKHPADLGVLSPRPSFCVAVKCRWSFPDGTVCDWRISIDPEDERPTLCPLCGHGKLGFTTTDASEYAWWLYGPGRVGRWFPLAWKNEAAA